MTLVSWNLKSSTFCFSFQQWSAAKLEGILEDAETFAQSNVKLEMQNRNNMKSELQTIDSYVQQQSYQMHVKSETLGPGTHVQQQSFTVQSPVIQSPKSKGQSVPGKVPRFPPEARMPCPECGKVLSRAGLKAHMQHHTGDYKYNCTLCTKGFTTKRHLTDHLKKHEGRSSVCEYCLKAFKSSSVLQRHLVEHTGRYPFRCSVCNQGFTLRSALVAHENQHWGKGFTSMKYSKILFS